MVSRGSESSVSRVVERAPGDSARRRGFLAAVGGVLAALAGCTGAGLPGGNTLGSIRGQYVGTATTLVDHPDASGRSAGVRTYQLSVTVVIDRPASAGGSTESNPFNLLVAPSSPGAEGALEVWSAFPALDPRDGREVLFQYWELRLAGNDVAGRLVDNHTAEGAALNLINTATVVAPNVPAMTIPAAMAVGTTLQGTIQANELRLRIQGNTTDGSRPFRSDVTARRA